MAEHHRPRAGALVHGEIGVAHAARDDADEQLAGLGRAELDLLDPGVGRALARHGRLGLHRPNGAHVARTTFSD